MVVNLPENTLLQFKKNAKELLDSEIPVDSRHSFDEEYGAIKENKIWRSMPNSYGRNGTYREAGRVWVELADGSLEKPWFFHTCSFEFVKDELALLEEKIKKEINENK